MLRQPAQGVAGRGNWGIAAVHGVPAALKRLGLGMRPGTTLKVVEDTDSHVHLVLPPRPAGDLSEQALARKAADAGACAPAPAPDRPYQPVSRDVHVSA